MASIGGHSCCLNFVAPMGPADQRAAEEFNSVLVYTSEPLAEPVELIGDVTVTLYAATSARDTDWTARLCEVHPDGRSINLQEGIVRGRYRESLSEPSLLEPDRIYRYDIPLGPVGVRIAAGNRLRVTVSSSDFPQWDRNLNTGGDLFQRTAQRRRRGDSDGAPQRRARLTPHRADHGPLARMSESISSNAAPFVASGPFPELDGATIAGVGADLRARTLSIRELAEMYVERIEALDRHGPRLLSVIELNPEAMAIADGLDHELRTRGPRGPLHGIPVLLKDNIDTADQMLTTAGSLALVGSRPRRDAFVVKQLREAGVVLLGKTNMSEWANFRSSRSSSGWSARGGQCRNPYDLQLSPCGSSSGSAVAIAASLAAVAVGTETDGSIVCPASVNSVVGIKPTLGLVSRSGVIPIAHSQDTVGPFGRTVSDAAALLGVLTGPDPQDAATMTGSARPRSRGDSASHAGDYSPMPRSRGSARRTHWRAADGLLGE